MGDAPTLTVEADGPIRVLTLARPELLNRFDSELHRDFTRALTELASDDGARAVVLASTGKAFSAGGDFDLMRRAHDDAAIRRELVDEARALFLALVSLPQPIVAAVQGAAMGLGATVVLACDAVVAYRGALIADTHVNVGLVAGDGGCVVWPALAGGLRARRHLLSGDPLDAETAFALGMVTDLVDAPEDVVGEARALAQRLAALPPLAVRLTKQVLNQPLVDAAADVLERSLAAEEKTLASDDLLEGIAAFQERRPGEFTGR